MSANKGEKAALYLGAAFAAAVLAWVLIAFVRTEGIVEDASDWRILAFVAALMAASHLWRRKSRAKTMTSSSRLPEIRTK